MFTSLPPTLGTVLSVARDECKTGPPDQLPGQAQIADQFGEHGTSDTMRAAPSGAGGPSASAQEFFEHCCSIVASVFRVLHRY